ncbi:uncharacterized protein LOC135209677 [Macrobrachium nipponense]|uniref:uncharacterized protein LOC135209677 n=1 Tax=Macrobrachium nipponense TaxID=159736 RepID=UPI0030C8ADF0
MGDSGGTAGVVGPHVDPQEAVDQLFGAGRARVVDAVTSTRVTEREVILVNGVPVQLVGDDGDALKAALLAGRLPDQALVNRVLASVLGADLRGVTKVESNLKMTSRVTTKDTLTVHQNGRVVDERSSESHLDTSPAGALRRYPAPAGGALLCSPRPPPPPPTSPVRHRLRLSAPRPLPGRLPERAANRPRP